MPADSRDSRGHSPEPAADPLIGQHVGRFIVDKKLGEGGMGAVYRMRHAELPDTFQALKILTLSGHGNPAAEREILDRFLQEAHAAAAVGSHRVAQIFDVGQLEDGTRYLVMEYVRGRSVADALAERGALPVVEALLVAARVADTLAIAHGRGIIHRDIKPANLMLLAEGRDPAVKVLDFGIARATGEGKVAHTVDRKIIGSPGYMSPEAAIGAPVDGRADVYSLCATLFEMLTGRIPVSGNTVNAILMNTISEPVPSASSLRPRALGLVPPAVEALLGEGLQKNPAERPTMESLRVRLVELCDSLVSAEERGVVGASVMRSAESSNPAHRPTLSAGADLVAEVLSRFGPEAQPTRPLAQIADSPPPQPPASRTAAAIGQSASRPAEPPRAAATSAANAAARAQPTSPSNRGRNAAMAIVAIVVTAGVGLAIASIGRRDTSAPTPQITPETTRITAPAESKPIQQVEPERPARPALRERIEQPPPPPPPPPVIAQPERPGKVDAPPATTPGAASASPSGGRPPGPGQSPAKAAGAIKKPRDTHSRPGKPPTPAEPEVPALRGL